MEDMKERLVKSVSTGELERRWKAAREVMKDRKIDFLVMRQDEEYYGGYVRWFSAITPRHSYPVTVIFAIDDEMTTIASSPPAPPNDGRPPEWAVRGVKTRLWGLPTILLCITPAPMMRSSPWDSSKRRSREPSGLWDCRPSMSLFISISPNICQA